MHYHCQYYQDFIISFQPPLFYRDQIKLATVKTQFNSTPLLSNLDYSPGWFLTSGLLHYLGLSCLLCKLEEVLFGVSET